MRIGDVIDGKYEIVRLLGEGGMGAVFEAFHRRISRRVALKVLHSELTANAEMVERFIREAQMATAVGSDHIVEITDGGEAADGSPFLVMEYLDGVDLKEVLRREGPLAPPRAVGLIAQVCEALSAAHARSIIHRDLKPENLFITRKPDGSEWVKVLDFGIAKLQDTLTQHPSLTTTGTTMGTPYYMAPEQFGGSKHVSERSDVYSLGVILYEILAGRPPYDGDTYEQLVVAIATATATPLRALRPEVSPGLEEVVSRAMARDVAARTPSMVELHAAIAPFGAPGAATAPLPVGNAMPVPMTVAMTAPSEVEMARTITPAEAQAAQAVAAVVTPLTQPQRVDPTPATLAATPVPVVPQTMTPESGLPAPPPASGYPPQGGSQPLSGAQPVATPSAWESAPPRKKSSAGFVVGVSLLGLLVLCGAGGATYLYIEHTDRQEEGGSGSGAVVVTTDNANAGTETTATSLTAATTTPAGTEPAVGNRWVAVPPPAAAVKLGLSPEHVAAKVRGFRPDRAITAPTTPFEIQQHEVTWRSLRPWLAAHTEHTVTAPPWLPAAGTEDLPATAVPWAVAQAYCQSLGGSLPTEEQWEYAARGVDRRPYPWGGEALDPARVHVYRPGQPLSAVMTAAQDATPAGAGGALHDMLGNALEWTASLYREDVAGADESWVDAEGMTFRAVRGLPPAAERPAAMPVEAIANRDALCATGSCPQATAEILQHVGFRCVRSPQ